MLRNPAFLSKQLKLTPVFRLALIKAVAGILHPRLSQKVLSPFFQKDKYSVEIFVNDGEQVMTSTFYTDLDATDISFYAKGNATINIEKHDIAVK